MLNINKFTIKRCTTYELALKEFLDGIATRPQNYDINFSN